MQSGIGAFNDTFYFGGQSSRLVLQPTQLGLTSLLCLRFFNIRPNSKILLKQYHVILDLEITMLLGATHSELNLRRS